MYSEGGLNETPHDFVHEFVDLGQHPEEYSQSTFYEISSNQDSKEYSEQSRSQYEELFFSPLMNGAGSAEPTPLMTPHDHASNGPLPNDFAMPPSYFSPSLSPSMHPTDSQLAQLTDFDLTKSGNANSRPISGRVRKQPSSRRRYVGSRHNSVTSTPSSTRHNSSASPQNNTSPEDEDSQAPDVQQTGAVTPASLMNVNLSQQPAPSNQLDENLSRAIFTTVQLHRDRRASGGSQSSVSSAVTPSLRPKRGTSTSSSPAIAPYMSPALAPNDAGMAALLASKSNYQNIMDGKHQELGLQYPERLTADLTNKKASHKIAEQERRNRINSAITELGRLVTPDNPLSSKAATVEAAILHIKDLNKQIAELKARLEEE